MNREAELGKLMQEVGKRLEERGKVYSRKMHDWHKAPAVQIDSTRGGGGVEGDVMERRADRIAARMFPRWVKDRDALDGLAHSLLRLMDDAEKTIVALDKHRTPAQVEADGFCGSCWRIGKLVSVQCRPSGEPYVRGRCRFCRDWPNHLPALDDLRTYHAGRTVWVSA